MSPVMTGAHKSACGGGAMKGNRRVQMLSLEHSTGCIKFTASAFLPRYLRT